jgi:hypothetical protein
MYPATATEFTTNKKIAAFRKWRSEEDIGKISQRTFQANHPASGI